MFQTAQQREHFVINASFCLIFLLLLLQIVVQNIESTEGIAVAQIEHETTQLHDKNLILREELLNKEALLFIAPQAAKQGFVETTPFPLP